MQVDQIGSNPVGSKPAAGGQQKGASAGRAPTNPPAAKTEEDFIHTLISDVYHITNESGPKSTPSSKYGAQPKTFIYEFCEDGKKFTVADLDIILCIRLAKNRDENKFEFLFDSYERLEKHIIAKRKQSAETI